MIKKHILYYVSLVILLIVGFSTAFFFSNQKNLQIGVLIFTAFLYALWGVVHHGMHHSFSLRVMLEYISVAILGIAIVFFVLQIGL